MLLNLVAAWTVGEVEVRCRPEESTDLPAVPSMKNLLGVGRISSATPPPRFPSEPKPCVSLVRWSLLWLEMNSPVSPLECSSGRLLGGQPTWHAIEPSIPSLQLKRTAPLVSSRPNQSPASVLSTTTTTMATSAYCCCNTLLHLLPIPTCFGPARRLELSPVARFATRRAFAAAARPGTKARASSGPPPPFLETEEADEERGWSGAESESDGGGGGSDEEEEQEWAGGNGAVRGEDLGADAGEDLSGWKRQWPRPRELFVCNLPRRCGAEDLLELFRPHGTVLSVEIKRDAETGISRGCAFVTMRSLAEARAAVEALDGFDMDGREVFVKVASHVISNRKNVKLPHITPMKDHIFESPHKIYVGNLAWSVQPHDLRELFAQCGTVVSTRLLTDRKGGRNRVYGFLSFSSAGELEAALKLDRTVFHGRDIIVKEAHLERQTHGAVKVYS